MRVKLPPFQGSGTKRSRRLHSNAHFSRGSQRERSRARHDGERSKIMSTGDNKTATHNRFGRDTTCIGSGSLQPSLFQHVVCLHCWPGAVDAEWISRAGTDAHGSWGGRMCEETRGRTKSERYQEYHESCCGIMPTRAEYLWQPSRLTAR